MYLLVFYEDMVSSCSHFESEQQLNEKSQLESQAAKQHETDSSHKELQAARRQMTVSFLFESQAAKHQKTAISQKNATATSQFKFYVRK